MHKRNPQNVGVLSRNLLLHFHHVLAGGALRFRFADKVLQIVTTTTLDIGKHCYSFRFDSGLMLNTRYRIFFDCRYNLSVKPIPGLPDISLQVLPGLQEYLDSIMKIMICKHMVFPKSLNVPIADSHQKGSSFEVEEIGRLRVVVDKARNLPDADWGFMGMGKSDPYVKIGVGAQGQLPPQFERTRTINDDLNPTWDEIFDFKVHSLQVQELVVEVSATRWCVWFYRAEQGAHFEFQDLVILLYQILVAQSHDAGIGR